MSRNAVNCPSHPTVPWESGTFHGMSTCPSTDACVSNCPSHGPMGQWDCPSHPTVPWNSGTFYGMSTCPSYRYSHCSFHSTIPWKYRHSESCQDLDFIVCVCVCVCVCSMLLGWLKVSCPSTRATLTQDCGECGWGGEYWCGMQFTVS